MKTLTTIKAEGVVADNSFRDYNLERCSANLEKFIKEAIKKREPILKINHRDKKLDFKELKKIEGKPLVNLEKKQLCGILDFYGYSYKINQGKYYVTIKLV